MRDKSSSLCYSLILLVSIMSNYFSYLRGRYNNRASFKRDISFHAVSFILQILVLFESTKSARCF